MLLHRSASISGMSVGYMRWIDRVFMETQSSHMAAAVRLYEVFHSLCGIPIVTKPSTKLRRSRCASMQRNLVEVGRHDLLFIGKLVTCDGIAVIEAEPVD